MLRASWRRLCATTVANGSTPKSSATGADASSLKNRTQGFLALLEHNKVHLDGVEVQPSETQGRGLIAKRTFREGTTVLSVPMENLALSSELMLERSPYLQSLKPPTYNDVRRHMTLHSVQDPVVYQQVHLALIVAAERMNPNSLLKAYFDVLPHPAMDDAAVLALHKDVIDPTQLLEWETYQRVFLTSIRELLKMWGPRAPPVEVTYWALRTVLSRMHMLPDRGLAPSEIGSTLNYSALSTYMLAENQSRILTRLKNSFVTLFSSRKEEEEYRLVPTLVPLLDMATHLSSSNVGIEVHPRPELGSCAELQAITEIKEGDQIGLCFNRSQSVAFTLYRFGFLPL